MNLTPSSRALLILLVALALPLSATAAAAPAKDAALKALDFERFSKANNPWAGVDGQGYLRVFEASATVVTNSGRSVATPLPCSPNAVDMNGDGILDLVVADAEGYTWFYPNVGTKEEPKFTFGEVIPIMLSSGGSQCLGLAAVDYDDSGKPGLIYGDWLGQIFIAPNLGSNKEPRFMQPKEASDYKIATSKDGRLWGNYFYPTMYDWNGDGRKDLILGEGTYSANSIWLMINQGSSATPVYNQNEGKRIPLIRGLGREHLTPAIIDWNGDGRPDVVTGEREGGVSVYINATEAGSKESQFLPPTPIKFGNAASIGALSRLTFADINGDGLPDAIVGRSNGRIGIALNTGTATEPSLGAIKDVNGTNPLPPYARSPDASFAPPERSTFHLLKVVSNIPTEKETFEEGYAPPPDSSGKRSLKIEFCDTKQKVFTNPLPLSEGNRNYGVDLRGGFRLEFGKDYTLTFWVKNRGFRRMSWTVECNETVVIGKDEDSLDLTQTENYSVSREFGASDSWSKITETFRITKKSDSKTTKSQLGGSLKFGFSGQGAVYLDDVRLVEGGGF
ncbi:hypothetical protein DB346_21395 [Verrucomicrobia bacterium LW23]|nr:hypothetical protein DB346_21395 [Verrucomicrobia bacterium LW23]